MQNTVPSNEEKPKHKPTTGVEDEIPYLIPVSPPTRLAGGSYNVLSVVWNVNQQISVPLLL